MKTIAVIHVLFLILFAACGDKKRSPTPSKKTSSSDNTVTEIPRHLLSLKNDSPDAKAMRKNFMVSPFIYHSTCAIPTVNFVPTAYAPRIPKATMFADYNSERMYDSIIAVNFDWSFEQNLPPQILAELEKRHLLNTKKVDIAWVVQGISSMGGNAQDGLNNITYLKAHGWADPDAPSGFSGTRLYRDYLYGIFDADIDISHEVKLSEMKPFLIYTHDNKYSPKTGAVHLPSSKPESIALWTLVIDSNNPDGNVRSIATLHWLLSESDEKNFYKESMDIKGKMIFNNIGDYISNLKTTSFLKKSSLVKKLELLTQP